MRMPLPIADGFYESESLPLSAQRCINWMPVVPQTSGALASSALFNTPGIELFTTLTGVNRGSYVMDGVAYFINGTTLYEVSSAGVSNDRGTIPGSSRVSMADNGRYLVIVVPGASSYVYDNTNNTLAKITDIDFRAASSVVYKDGYFLFSASDGSVFFSSALNDPFTYDALDFASAEISPDKIIALHVNHNELFVLGESTIEIFQNIGGVAFPFQRIAGANIQKGCYAKASLVEFDNTFLFIGGGLNERAAIWRVTSSSSAAKISTAAIDYALQKYTPDEIANAFAWTYSSNGNFFAGFTVYSDDKAGHTFVYDATASALSGKSVWHERQSGVVDARWRVNSIVTAYGKLYVGDSETGKIGELKDGIYTEYGDPVLRVRTSQPFSGDGLPVFSGEIALTMEAGTGLTTGQGSDPQIRMDWSDDGGRNFGSELSRGYGAIGAYEVVPTWRRLGRFPQQRVVRFSTSEPVKSNMLKMEAEIEGGYQ